MSLDEQLSALLAGDLPPSQAAVLRVRIDTEPEVAAQWARMLELSALLDDLPLPELPEELVQATVDAAGEHAPAEPPAPTWNPRAWALVLVAFAAGLALGLGLGAREAPVPGGSEADRVPVEAPSVVPSEPRRLVPEDAPDDPAAAPREPETCDEALDEATATLERLEVELALARGRLVTHEGESLPWPDDVLPTLRPGAFEVAARQSVAEVGQGELLAVDCSEYPCAVVLYAEHGLDEELDWNAPLQPLARRVGPPWQVVNAVRHEDRRGRRHAVAVIGLMDPEEAELYEPRLMFRVRELIDAFQPEVMRTPPDR